MSEDQLDRPSAAVELVDVTKQFPGVLANDAISLTMYRGEVHCLLGENGAGKSTLMGILSGMLQPDSGRIRIDGSDAHIDSPRRALELGIGTVYQHTTLIPALTVIENLMLGSSGGVRLDVEGSRTRLKELADRLGITVDPNAVAGSLALGRQQQVEIIKALWRGSRVLILDEPTSMLTPTGVAELQQVLEELKGQGLAIAFITHKLHEALAIGDRVSVLRRGRLVGGIDHDEFRASSPDEVRDRIIQMMFGDEATAAPAMVELALDSESVAADRPAAAFEPSTTTPMLELVDVTAAGDGDEPGITGVSLTLGEHEILGIAGIDGNGQRALAEVIAGQRRPMSGSVKLYDAAINRLGVAARQKLGLRYVTDDRLGEGVVTSFSVAINLFIKRIGEKPYFRFGAIVHRTINAEARRLVDAFDVRTPSVRTRAGTLSGGNIQKVVLARELSFEPKVVVFHKPTYGLDLRTTQVVRGMVRDLAGRGGSALVISTDLDELIELCGRIAVLSRGHVVGMVRAGPGAAEEIGALMIGSQTTAETA